MSVPSLDSEYADTAALATRIDTHARYSEHPDDPIASVLDTLDLTGAEDLADIGCGDGRFLARLTASGHHGKLVGIDNSTAMVAATRATPGVISVRADATAIPFPDNAFDVITARHMLYHLPESQPAAALREWRRITRPGGRVLVTVNHFYSGLNTHRLVAEHAQRYGITETPGLLNPAVSSDTITYLMGAVFDDITVMNHDNALVFDEPVPLIRFAESLFSFCGIALKTPGRVQILADLTSTIHSWFHAHPGQPWRDPKGYSIAIATLS